MLTYVIDSFAIHDSFLPFFPTTLTLLPTHLTSLQLYTASVSPIPSPQFLRFLDNRHRPASEAQLAIPAKMPVEYSSTPALNLDDEAEAELWFNEGVKTLSSQVYIKAFSLRELFLQLDTNRTGAVTVEQLVDSMLQNGFPEPGNPETRPRLLNVVHRTMRILYDLRSRRTDGPSVAGMTAQQRLARAARAYNGDVSYLDMVDIFLGRISPLKLKKMQEERKDKYGDDDTESERRYMRVQQVLRHALRAARADRATFDNLYRSMDKDRDGWISIDEICQGLEALSIGANFSKQNEFRLFVAQYCHVQPGYLNPEEYDAFMNLRHPSTCTPERLELDALMNAGARANAVRAAPIPMPANARPEQLLEVLVEHLSEEFIELQTAFKQFDADCDGRISEAEFFHAINDLGIAASPSVAKTLFESFDLNGVGVVTLNEFVRALGTLRQQMQFRKANRRPSVAVESGMSQINAQLSSKAGVMTNTNVNVATGLARPQTATAVLTGGSSAKKLDFSDVFNLSRSEFELTDAAVKSIVKALRVNPNSATRDIFRRVDRGNKNKVSTQDIVFAFEAANPSLPVPMEAIKAVMTRLCPSGDDALGLSAFTRLLSAKGVSDL